MDTSKNSWKLLFLSFIGNKNINIAKLIVNHNMMCFLSRLVHENMMQDNMTCPMEDCVGGRCLF
jgi:hypothetical protein